MTVGGITDYLEQHWPAVREQLLNGTYEPKPVRWGEIPKPDGGCESLASRVCAKTNLQKSFLRTISAVMDLVRGFIRP